MNSPNTYRKKYTFSFNENLLELTIEDSQVDVVLARSIIDEIKKINKDDYSKIKIVVKSSLLTVFTQTSRDLLASFFKENKFHKIAYLAQNRYQISNGNLLINSCKNEVEIKICFYEKEIEEWFST